MLPAAMWLWMEDVPLDCTLLGFAGTEQSGRQGVSTEQTPEKPSLHGLSQRGKESSENGINTCSNGSEIPAACLTLAYGYSKPSLKYFGERMAPLWCLGLVIRMTLITRTHKYMDVINAQNKKLANSRKQKKKIPKRHSLIGQTWQSNTKRLI